MLYPLERPRRWWLRAGEVAARITTDAAVDDTLPLIFEWDDGTLWGFRFAEKTFMWDHTSDGPAGDFDALFSADIAAQLRGAVRSLGGIGFYPRELTREQAAVVDQLARVFRESPDGTVSGKRLRQLLGDMDSDVFDRIQKPLQPRFVGEREGANGEIFNLRLPGLLRSEAASAAEDVIVSALRVFAAKYKEHADFTTFRLDEVMSAGSFPREAQVFVNNVLTYSVLAKSPPAGSLPAADLHGAPGDTETLRKCRSFSDFIRATAKTTQEERPWPTAPVRSEAADGYQRVLDRSAVKNYYAVLGAKRSVELANDEDEREQHVRAVIERAVPIREAARPLSTTPSSEREIDFVILTAIDVERRAVCDAFMLGDGQRVKRDARVYWRGRLPLSADESYEIVVAQSRDMANVDMAILANDSLHHWKPNAALLVGIAATTKSDEVPLGDVIVATAIWYYERGKITTKGKASEPQMFHADAALLNNVLALPDWDGVVPLQRPDGTSTVSRVHTGVIASGEKVIASRAIRDDISSGHRKIRAIEMEGYGFGSAIAQCVHRVHHLVIRAISDDGTRRKNDRWHAYAAAAASRYAKHLLCDRPLPPRNA